MRYHRDCGSDAAAYALGALEHAEAQAFRDHLATCAVCRDEVSAFGSVVDVLPLAVPPQRAPQSLKRRVMDQVRVDSRAKPLTAPRRQSGWIAAFPRPVLALGATAMVVVIAVGGVLLGSGGSGAGSRVFHASVAFKNASAVLSVQGGRGELVLKRMQPPPAGQVYEVWLQRGSHPPEPTTALFSVTAAGSGTVDVPGNLRGVTQMMVTPEPAGGSKVPTHPPVLVAQLT
ncbi:MAG: anti-sigma factor [Solirubrobacteraceae bacterium]